MGKDAKTVKVERGTLGQRCRELGKLGGVQGGWGGGCREAESREFGRRSGQGDFQKCRKVSRSAGARSPRGEGECRQKCREGGNSAGRREAYGWHRSLAGCRSRKEAVNKAAQAPLVPMGAGLGHRLGSPQGRMGPRQLPTGRKVLECRAEPLTYTLWERRGRDRQRRWWGETRRDKGEVGRTDRREQGQGLVKLPLPTLPFLPACPRPPLTA